MTGCSCHETIDGGGTIREVDPACPVHGVPGYRVQQRVGDDKLVAAVLSVDASPERFAGSARELSGRVRDLLELVEAATDGRRSPRDILVLHELRGTLVHLELALGALELPTAVH